MAARRPCERLRSWQIAGHFTLALQAFIAPTAKAQLGREVAVERHLEDADEYRIGTRRLIAHGRRLFEAVWTRQEGGGRPLAKGTGRQLADPGEPLLFPRDFNRVSAPDANSCAGCHNVPRSGGGGDVVANVFVLGQRFDFATFDVGDGIPTKGAADEAGAPVHLQTIANSRNTLGMFGSGFIEMLARQMTSDLQTIRNAIPPGDSLPLETKGVSFGCAREGCGRRVGHERCGLSAASLASGGPADAPSLAIRPFHQVGAVVALREFTNNAFNHHRGSSRPSVSAPTPTRTAMVSRTSSVEPMSPLQRSSRPACRFRVG